MPDEERTVETTFTGFTPVPDVIAQDPDMGPVTALVWGLVWRFSQMKHGVCYASQTTLAIRTGISRKTVNRHLEILCKAGYLRDLTPDLEGKPHTYMPTDRLQIRGQFEVVENADSTRSKPRRSKRSREKVYIEGKYAEYIEH